MSQQHTLRQARLGGGVFRMIAASAAVLVAISAYALPVWLEGGEAQAQGGVGAGGGSAAATISGATNVLGVPGGTASVSFSLASEEGQAAAVGFDVVYDSTFVDVTEDNCQLPSRLEDQIRSVTFPPSDQPAPPNRRLRLGVFPPIANPVPSFSDGEVFVCDFSVATNAPLNTTVDLAVEPLQVARADRSKVCEFETCGAVNGSIRIGAVTPPTATRTPSVVATSTPTRTPTQTAGATSTPTSTSTSTEGPTNTPTETATTSPTGGESPTNTPTRTATGQPTSTPTSTSPPGGTATATAGGQRRFNDSCAVVPAGQSNPYGSLVLLLGPALLLWARRRGN